MCKYKYIGYFPEDGKEMENVPLTALTMISNHTGIRHYFYDLKNKMSPNNSDNDKDENDDSEINKQKTENNNNWEYQMPMIFSNYNKNMNSDLNAEISAAVENIGFLFKDYYDILTEADFDDEEQYNEY